ncbi:MAG: SPOR domain-containing protein [Steroidobacteraceae bacterium]
MRSLCLLLILGNVLYLIWAQFIDLDFSSYSVPVANGALTRNIALASETNRLEPTAPADVPAAPPSSASGECVSVGPFSTLSESTRAAATLSAAGFNSKQRIEQGELWAGYWVYVPDLGVPGAAESAIRQLRERGVVDVFVLPGESAPVLSLGVFVDIDRARRRAQIAQELGLRVRMVDRKRTGSIYWIDATPTQPGQTLDPSMFPPEPGKIVRIELQPCPQRSAG